MSKMLCLGMNLNEVIAASTVNAAVAVKRMEYGTLKVGALGDATFWQSARANSTMSTCWAST